LLTFDCRICGISLHVIEHVEQNGKESCVMLDDVGKCDFRAVFLRWCSAVPWGFVEVKIGSSKKFPLQYIKA
jgi:hypothetical protein